MSGSHGTMKFRPVAMAVLTFAIALTAYGVGTGTATAAESGHKGALVPFKVGMVNALNDEPYHYALEQGYYKAAGLKVILSLTDSGPAVVTGVLNGTYDAAVAAALPILIAIDRGLPLRIYRGTDVLKPGTGGSALIVKPGSSIKGYTDLAGKTVATNALTSLLTLALRLGLTHAGVNPDSVKIVALPFKASAQAVAQGQVDAAVVITPFSTEAEISGLKIIADPMSDMMPNGSPESILFTTEQNTKTKAKEFAAFNKATVKAINELMDDAELQRKLARTEIGLSSEVAAKVPLPNYSTAPIDLTAFQKYADDAAEYGFTKKPVDVSKVTASFEP